MASYIGRSGRQSLKDRRSDIIHAEPGRVPEALSGRWTSEYR